MPGLEDDKKDTHCNMSAYRLHVLAQRVMTRKVNGPTGGEYDLPNRQKLFSQDIALGLTLAKQ